MTTATKKIRVMVVDDHDMVIKGLSVLLEMSPDFEMVGKASNGRDAIEECRRLQPDVLLIDLVMPGMGGVEAIPSIRKVSPHTQIITLTNFKDEEMVQGALKGGAIGYLLKNVSVDDLSNAIRSAYLGKSILAPEAAQVLIEATVRPPAPGHDLTDREREVLRLIVNGLNNREIGNYLTISPSTVKNHVSNIFAKLGVSKRTEAVTLAIQSGLVRQ
jgi:NarL family two-component system response regulator LiaR